MNHADRARLSEDVQDAEGWRPKAYQDSVGVWTVGYGTNLQELIIDTTLGARWLAEGLASAEREAERAFPWYAEASPRRQRAIVELIYNMGLPRLLGFRDTLAACAGGRWHVAAAELLDSKWAGQVGPTRANRIAAMLREGR